MSPETWCKLKSLGVVIALDDFGYRLRIYESPLRALPLDMLKIDRSYTAHLKITWFVHSIFATSRRLNCKWWFSGVETREQLHQLIVMGCDIAQGLPITTNQ